MWIRSYWTEVDEVGASIGSGAARIQTVERQIDVSGRMY
jgi:transcription antitermination factor NusA-like protein